MPASLYGADNYGEGVYSANNPLYIPAAVDIATVFDGQANAIIGYNAEVDVSTSFGGEAMASVKYVLLGAVDFTFDFNIDAAAYGGPFWVDDVPPTTTWTPAPDWEM